MKKFLSVLLAVSMIACSVLALSSCNLDFLNPGNNPGTKSDAEAIEEKGWFVCGITLYAPINYIDEETEELVGFDTDFAKAVAEDLGLEAKFQVISWGSKYLELNSGAIDCIWNGFTYGNENDGTPRTDYVDFSYAYLNNSQCIVMKAENVASFTSLESLSGKDGAAEAGSSGAGVVEGIDGANLVECAAQTSALMEVASGEADFAVIDVLMANSMVGQGDYAGLAVNTAITLDDEVYAIGFRKGSDFTAKVNASIAKLSANGKLAEIAAKYELTNALIPNIGK